MKTLLVNVKIAKLNLTSRTTRSVNHHLDNRTTTFVHNGKDGHIDAQVENYSRLTYTNTVVRKSQDWRPLDQKQGGPEEATRRAEDRVGSITSSKDRRWFRFKTHKDVCATSPLRFAATGFKESLRLKLPELVLNTRCCSHDLRKSIAKVLTIINANQRAQLRLFYKNKKYLPLDLRPKRTRAIRRRLSKEDKARVLEKTAKRKMHFPQRKYAVKVRLNSHLPSFQIWHHFHAKMRAMI
jgi:hypothetical protein